MKYIKRFFCIALSVVFFANIVMADEISQNIETINLNVNIVQPKQYNEIKQNFKPLDLSPYANNSLYDEVDGDGKGGWSDQGNNDMRYFDLAGTYTMNGVPFMFVDPKRNKDLSLVSLQGQNDPRLPNRVEIDINDTAGGVYFVHASPWAQGICGTYSFLYEDGSMASFDVENSKHIRDHFGTFSDDEYVRSVWTGPSASSINLTSSVTICMFALNNPHPEKKISKLVLQTSGGGAYVMIFAITLTDTEPFLPTINGKPIFNPAPYNWFAYEQPDEDKMKGSALDFSYLLDTPAGKHGGISTNGDSIVFADGTPAKFWGTNITGNACFPDKQQAESIASKIAMNGINLVRFVDFDKYISEANIESFAYLLSCLKEKGIYYYLAFASEDEYKIRGFISPKLKENQKRLLSMVLGYKSIYTKGTICEDPALIMIELTDKNSMMDYNASTHYGSLDNDDYNMLKERFNTFLKNKYTSTSKLKSAWNAITDLDSFENIEDSSVNIYAWKNGLFSDAHKKDISMFLGEIQTGYFNEMKKVIQGLGCKALITCNSNSSNKNDSYYDSYLNYKMSDFVSRQSVWNKPTKNTSSLDTNFYYDNLDSMVFDMYGGSIGDLAKTRFLNKPYIISEWNIAEPNYYISEAPVMMSAFAAQQDWSAIQYSFIQDKYSDSGSIEDLYSMYNHPVRLSLMPAAAAIFYTTESTKSTNVRKMEEEKLNLLNVSDDESNAIILGQKSGITATSYRPDTLAKKDSTLIINKQVLWDISDKVFTVETDYVNAFTGFINQTEQLEKIGFSLDNEHVSIVLTALNNKTIDTADRLLLTAVNMARNTKLKIDSHYISNIGNCPILVEPIVGEITLKMKGSYSIYPLTSSGERQEQLSVKKSKDGYTTFMLSANRKAIHYEIVKN